MIIPIWHEQPLAETIPKIMVKLFLFVATSLIFSSLLVAKTDLSALSRTFAIESGLAERPSLELLFKQSWRQKEQASFSPGHVALYPRSRGLAIIASFSDEVIFSKATGMNQPMWELGDVFEIFVGISGQPEYWELHVTPNNHRLQLMWTEETFISFRKKESVLSDHAMTDVDFLSVATRINQEKNYWQVYVFLPWASIGLSDGNDLYDLELAFCRYDSSSDGRPSILSATAPFKKLNFHAREQWSKVPISMYRASSSPDAVDN